MSAPNKTYRKICPDIWCDEKTKDFNFADYTVWFYLLTGHHWRSIPGIFDINLRSFTGRFSMGFRRLKEILDRMESLDLIVWDRRTDTFFVKNALKYNKPENTNCIKGWAARWSQIPSSELKNIALAETYKFMMSEEVSIPCREAFLEGFAEPLAEGFAQGFLEGLTEPIANTKNKEQRTKNKEQRKEKKNPVVLQEQTDGRDSEIRRVLDFYQATHPKTKRRTKGSNDWKKINARLDDGFSEADLCKAIFGNSRDEWHVERNKHEMEYIFRNATNVERFAALTKIKPKEEIEREEREREEKTQRLRSKCFAASNDRPDLYDIACKNIGIDPKQDCFKLEPEVCVRLLVSVNEAFDQEARHHVEF